MKVCLEATSLLGPRSGVGHTTAALARALVDADPSLEIVLLPLSVRGTGRLRRIKHPRITRVRTRVPARAASWVWTKGTWPPAEMLCGAVDVFHGPNYVLPPLLKAAGVLTIHDLAFVRMPEACSPHVRTYTRTVPVAAARAARIIVPSTFTASELAEWLPDTAARIRIVPMAVREEFLAAGGGLAAPRAHELGVRDRYVLFVGNLEARKNVDLLLRAFGEVRMKTPGAQLVLAGQPSVGWHDVAAAHAALLASGDVALTGYLPDLEIAALVRGASAFVYPSTYEGFGLPPLEAMACGVPVVAAHTSALPETLGGHARMLEGADPAELARLVVDALEHGRDDPGLADARRWARGFTWERTAQRTLEVYREAIAEVRP